jgi:hypothetical protein
MPLSSSRWTLITPSDFPWEREALDYLRENLPDVDPYRVWANFEFIALGTLLFESPRGIYQDWEATHVTFEKTKRRVRIYNVASQSSKVDREMIRKAAYREFRFWRASVTWRQLQLLALQQML